MFGRLLIRARALRVVIVAALGAHAALCAGTASADTAEAKKIFTTRCMACHTFGKGAKVGPDLKGVTERRERPWLLKFIRSSQTVIGSGDPTATGLFERFGKQRMPDWTDLSEPQIGSILDWLAINGPDQQDADARFAESATTAEIDAGRLLFHGGRGFVNGGVACAACHSIRDDDGRRGGTFASDLSTSYSQYQDGGMTQFLRHPCVQRFPESTLPAFLAPEESFALKAYLRTAALTDQSDSGGPRVAMVAKAVDGASPGAGGATGTTATQQSRSGATGPRRVAWAPRTSDAGSPTAHSAALPSELLFLAFPYAALLILIVGLGIRHAMARRQPDSMRVATTEAWRLFRGTLAWRIGLAATAAAHVVGLVLPRAILVWNGMPIRLYLLEGSGFLFGGIALVGLVQIMWHHVGRNISATPARLPEVADYAFLSLFCVAIVSGLVSAVLYRWGSSWAVATLAPYMASLVRGAPATALVEQMPFLVRLHVFSLFALMALLPFTSAAMVLVSAGDRALMFAARPIAAVTGAAHRASAKLSPARWLWPEEDAVDLASDADNAQEPG